MAVVDSRRKNRLFCGPLIMLPPQDPVVAATGTFSAELYEVLGNGYGLPDAPRVWNRKVNQGFDRCFYYYVDSEDKLRAVMIVHVDDFMCAYHEDFDSTSLRTCLFGAPPTLFPRASPGPTAGRRSAS